MRNPSVNRYLKNKAMDHIDHALGRPIDPLHESYRNYFAIVAGTNLAEGFEASPHWRRARNGGEAGEMIYFHVTTAGRQALADHLKEIGDRHALFAVTWDGITCHVPAVSVRKAKYKAWLDASDGRPELRFFDFIRAATAARVSVQEAVA